MKTKHVIAAWCLLLLPVFLSGQAQTIPAEEEVVAMVKQIYKEVSSEGGAQVDWDQVRSFFVKEAVIVLQTSKEASTQFTLEEFIQDFKDFYKSPALGESGFKEEVLRIKSRV